MKALRDPTHAQSPPWEPSRAGGGAKAGAPLPLPSPPLPWRAAAANLTSAPNPLRGGDCHWTVGAPGCRAQCRGGHARPARKCKNGSHPPDAGGRRRAGGAPPPRRSFCQQRGQRHANASPVSPASPPTLSARLGPSKGCKAPLVEGVVGAPAPPPPPWEQRGPPPSRAPCAWWAHGTPSSLPTRCRRLRVGSRHRHLRGGLFPPVRGRRGLGPLRGRRPPRQPDRLAHRERKRSRHHNHSDSSPLLVVVRCRDIRTVWTLMAVGVGGRVSRKAAVPQHGRWQ